MVGEDLRYYLLIVVDSVGTLKYSKQQECILFNRKQVYYGFSFIFTGSLITRWPSSQPSKMKGEEEKRTI